jgi:hypothetical protein
VALYLRCGSLGGFTFFVFGGLVESRDAAAHIPLGGSVALSYANLRTALYKLAAQDQK